MEAHGRKMTFHILLIFLLKTVTADPSTTCFQNSQKCEVENENLIDIYVETTWQECSLLCKDELNCLAFNHFGELSDFYPHNSCLLFSACENKVQCNDCVIGVSMFGFLPGEFSDLVGLYVHNTYI